MIGPRAVQRMDADVAIVGAGPAGCALATALGRRRMRVALLDSCASPRFRIGETFPPDVGDRLRRLGLWSSFLGLRPTELHGVLAAWGQRTPEAHSYFGHPDGCGWVVDRVEFDSLMRKAAVNEGAILAASVRLAAVDRSDDGEWTLRGVSVGGELRVNARFVVDASGRAAACAARIGASRRRLDTLVGLVWRLPRRGTAEPTLVEATPQGWWYTAAVPRGRMILAFLTDADVARTVKASSGWPPFISDAPLTASRVRHGLPPGVPLVFPAFTQTLEPAGGDRWLAIGDAAIGRDPISGSGVDFAFASAEMATVAIIRAFSGDRAATGVYGELIRRDFAAYLEERRAVYAAERRWPDARFWRQRDGTT